MAVKEVWGKCPNKELRHSIYHDRKQKTKHLWYYICTKSGAVCHQNYCLGPDEDKKGESDEEREDT